MNRRVIAFCVMTLIVSSSILPKIVSNIRTANHLPVSNTEKLALSMYEIDDLIVYVCSQETDELSTTYPLGSWEYLQWENEYLHQQNTIYLVYEPDSEKVIMW